MEAGFAGRLAEPFILVLLRRGPAHGYGLLQALQEAFGPEGLAKARIYQLLRRLESDGLIQEAGGEANRKLFALTPAGEAHLKEAAAQRPAFFNLLAMLFPDMGVGAANGQRAEEIPRDGARSQVACPGCDSLRVQMERTLPKDDLVIRVSRLGQSHMHAEGCVVGLALRRLAASLLP